VSGPAAVTALVLLECATGLVAGAAWTQSWHVVRRGHFRIAAWSALALACLAVAAQRGALDGAQDDTPARALAVATAVGTGLYVLAQYVRSDSVAVITGALAGAVGAAALAASAGLVAGWPGPLAALGLAAGAALVGATVNGMLLGHWYLNQPGLQPWALARLTGAGLVAVVAAALLGLAAAPRLADASTEGAVLGLPGYGSSFGAVFFAVWLGLVGLTGAVVGMARRCVRIRSIQSATGLLYVAVVTAAVAEFVVRFLMTNA
jgi:hypothetical protein